MNNPMVPKGIKHFRKNRQYNKIHKKTTTTRLRPLQNAAFCPISVSGSNLNPQNTICIPVVKIFAFLEREQNCAFFKGFRFRSVVKSFIDKIVNWKHPSTNRSLSKHFYKPSGKSTCIVFCSTSIATTTDSRAGISISVPLSSSGSLTT